MHIPDLTVRFAGRRSSSPRCGKRPQARLRWWSRAIGVGSGSVILLLLLATTSHAQYLQTYFPSGVPGYDRELGVTVLSRQRPLYEAPGIRAGSFLLKPDADESFGYDSNVLGAQGSPGSWLIETAPALTANSQWSRDSLGISLTANNKRYLNAPAQSHTDWTASIGGGYTIGAHDLSLAYSHLSLHQSPGDIGAVPSDNFVHYQVDDLRTAYTLDYGPFSFTPNAEALVYYFDNATIQGLPVSQQYRNRVVLSGGMTTRYALSDQRGLLLVLQGVDSHFIQPQLGQPSYNSHSFLALTGIDYEASGTWRYQLLAGFEVRQFQSQMFSTHAGPIEAASVIWTPTGLTTVTGVLSRTIEDTVSEGTAGYVYTNARLTVDHEYLRNVLLQGRAGLQIAQYLQGDTTQTSFTLGGGISWLMNRYMRLSADYDFTAQNSGAGTAVAGPFASSGLNTGKYQRNLVLIAMHFAL